MKSYTTLSLILTGLLISSVAQATVHSGYIKVYTPFHSITTAKSRGPNDLTFTKKPSIFAAAKYNVVTNSVGAGSGTVTVIGKDYLCTYDIYFDQQ